MFFLQRPRTSLFSVPTTFSFSVEALFDTSVFSSVLLLSTFNRLQCESPSFIIQYNLVTSVVNVANGASVSAYGVFEDTFKIIKETFTDTFLLLKSLHKASLGLPFSENCQFSIHPKKHLSTLIGN